MRKRLAAMAILLAAPVLAAPQPAADAPPEPALAQIRVSADGAGPSHLFWLTGDRQGDTIGVIDPLFAAIRFYRVAAGDGPVASRLSPLGVCALPVDFRPWRVHQFRNRVVIESMPDPGAAGYAAGPGQMRTRMVTVPRTLLAKPESFDAAARQVDTIHWNPATAEQCGTVSRTGEVGAGAPEKPRRLSERAIALGNARGALSPARALIVRSPINRLYAARELEPARGLRIVQASEAQPSDDGMIRVRTRILAFSNAGKLRRAVALRDSELRGKFGQKPVLVLPSGELLAMGKQPGDASPFRILSCGKITGTLTGICEADIRSSTVSVSNSRAPEERGSIGSAHFVPAYSSRPSRAATSSAQFVPTPKKPRKTGISSSAQIVPPTAGRSTQKVSRPSDRLSARTIFTNAHALISTSWSVDTSAMPEACRSPQGCPVGDSGEDFVPIRGIRLTRGIFRRTGLPYAQARVPEDVDRLLTASPNQLARALAQVRHGARGWPGNLKDGTQGDLGVDCSGLIQIAWGGRGEDRLDTRSLQRLSTPLACSTRLPGPEYLRAGDAIGLAIDAPVHLANHVVLFAGAMRLDGASDSWLTLESSSGCDGVCWSVYDPSMFDGWGIYRAGARGDAACIAGRGDTFTPIPYDLDRWTEQPRGH